MFVILIQFLKLLAKIENCLTMFVLAVHLFDLLGTNYAFGLKNVFHFCIIFIFLGPELQFVDHLRNLLHEAEMRQIDRQNSILANNARNYIESTKIVKHDKICPIWASKGFCAT